MNEGEQRRKVLHAIFELWRIFVANEGCKKEDEGMFALNANRGFSGDRDWSLKNNSLPATALIALNKVSEAIIFNVPGSPTMNKTTLTQIKLGV